MGHRNIMRYAEEGKKICYDRKSNQYWGLYSNEMTAIWDAVRMKNVNPADICYYSIEYGYHAGFTAGRRYQAIREKEKRDRLRRNTET